MRSESESVLDPSTRMGRSTLVASSVGSAAHSRLKANGGEGVVQGVFDGAINIRMGGGLITIVPQAGEKGPLNLGVRLPFEQKSLSSLGIRDGERVVLADSLLEIGDHCRILVGAASIYSPCLQFPAPLLRADEIGENLRVMTKAAILGGNMDGLGGLLALTQEGICRTKPGALNMFASAALPRIARLELALRAGEDSKLTVAVRELVGLGPGLTPSADDMLAALVLLSVLHSTNLKRRPLRVPIARVVASLPPGMTTALSEEFLRQAASGRGNERITRLCSAMLTGGPEAVERETKRVLGIGATSGTDAVLGIAVGTLFCLGRSPGLTSGGSE